MKLKFVKITGDARVPRGRISITGNIDHGFEDKNIQHDVKEEETNSYEDKLPWSIPLSNRPFVTTYAGYVQWASVVCVSFYFISIIISRILMKTNLGYD